jgi:hypothetical protein
MLADYPPWSWRGYKTQHDLTHLKMAIAEIIGDSVRFRYLGLTKIKQNEKSTTNNNSDSGMHHCTISNGRFNAIGSVLGNSNVIHRDTNYI